MAKECDVCGKSIVPFGEHYYLNATVCKKCKKKIDKDDIEDILPAVKRIHNDYERYEERAKHTNISDYNEDALKQLAHIKMVGVDDLKGHVISRYFDMIVSEVFVGEPHGGELSFSLEGLFGDGAGIATKKLEYAKLKAYLKLKQGAEEVGANAIVGTKVNYMSLNSNMIMFSVTGTPVKVEDF